MSAQNNNCGKTQTQNNENEKHKCSKNFRCSLMWSINFSIRFGCFIAFLFIAYYQIKKYLKNEDASVFSVKRFEGIDWESFPGITICFQSGEHPVSEGLYNETSIRSDLNITPKQYGEILLGIKNHENIKNILEYNFEENTIRLRDYLKKFRIQDTDENEYVWEYGENLEHPNFHYVINRPFDWNENETSFENQRPLFVKYLDPEIKCFSHHPQLDKGKSVDSVDFYFYISKLLSISDGRLYMYVHYKDQLLRSMRYIYKIRHFSGISRVESNNQIVLDLNYIRVVKNRVDAKQTCNKTLFNDDQEWLTQVVMNAGCIPPYWASLLKIKSKLVSCSSKSQLQLISKYLAFKNAYGRNLMFDKYKPPCQGTRVSANSNKDKYKKDDILKIKFRFRYWKYCNARNYCIQANNHDKISIVFIVLIVTMKRQMYGVSVMTLCGEA